jgi:hypothetical protein
MSEFDNNLAGNPDKPVTVWNNRWSSISIKIGHSNGNCQSDYVIEISDFNGQKVLLLTEKELHQLTKMLVNWSLS